MKFRIDHVAIWTTDLERLRSFYGSYFGATAGEKYSNPRTGFQSYYSDTEQLNTNGPSVV